MDRRSWIKLSGIQIQLGNTIVPINRHPRFLKLNKNVKESVADIRRSNGEAIINFASSNLTVLNLLVVRNTSSLFLCLSNSLFIAPLAMEFIASPRWRLRFFTCTTKENVTIPLLQPFRKFSPQLLRTQPRVEIEIDTCSTFMFSIFEQISYHTTEGIVRSITNQALSKSYTIDHKHSPIKNTCRSTRSRKKV